MILDEELGLDPEPETLALHGQLLNALSPEGESAEQRSVDSGLQSTSVASPLANLPQQLTPFIGREEDLAQFHQRLQAGDSRLLSIVGPGGMGKTRLALQIATENLQRFAHGVCFVPLAGVQSAAALPGALAETLDLAFVANQKSPATQLGELLSGKQLLLVLDNFEHLMDGVEVLVTLLQHAPKLVILVTSREQLNLQSEDLFELQGLPTPPSGTAADADHFAAVRLFVDRAHRLDKQFKLAPNQLPHVVRICQLVEGFPLAIELAATWLRDLTCQEIAAEVAAGLDRLETTLRDLAPQHSSLRTVFNSSWRLLSVAERRTLARLSVFRGGFSLDTARTVGQASPLVLHALRNKSLLRSAANRRYDMHVLVHQFSAEALATDAQSFALYTQAWAHHHLGQLPEALRCATEAVALARALDAPLTLAFALAHLAEAQMEAAQTEAEWAQAAANFQEAATTLRSIGKLIAAYESEIGLAELYRRRGQIATALALITPILPHLPTVAAVGWDEPVRAYVFCTRILQAAQDPVAERVLAQGVQLLARLAGHIADRGHRQHFLEALPAHRQIHALRFGT